MIQPGENIIYDSSQERVSLEYLLAHTNKRYSELLKTIKHVDMSLNLQGTTETLIIECSILGKFVKLTRV